MIIIKPCDLPTMFNTLKPPYLADAQKRLATID